MSSVKTTTTINHSNNTISYNGYIFSIDEDMNDDEVFCRGCYGFF